MLTSRVRKFGSLVTKYPAAIRGPSMESDRDFWMKHRSNRYRNLIERLQAPLPKAFVAHGKRYDLPYKPDGIPDALTTEGISEERIRYFATILGCEGSFQLTALKYTYIPRITISNVHHNAEIVFAFVRAFGGSVRMGGQPLGLRTPSIVWDVHGKHVSVVSSVLSKVCSPRQHLFNYFIKFVNASDPQYLSQLKQEFDVLPPFSLNVEDYINTPEQVAAVFDACGCFQISRDMNILILIQHRNDLLLHSVSKFLFQAGIQTSDVRHRQGRNDKSLFLNITKKTNVHLFLRLVLPYLEKKHAAVSLVLENWPFSTREEHEQLRQRLADVAPSRNRRMDDEWRRLSRDIFYLQKATNSKTKSKHVAEIHRLQRKRDSHKLFVKQSSLRSQARGLIQSGAALLPLPGKVAGSTRSFSSVAEPLELDDVDRWAKHRHDRYRHLVNGLVIPHPKLAIADGVEYGPLPYYLDGVPEMFSDEGISSERLRELAGFFSGDGSVRVGNSQPGYFAVALCIGSTYHRGERCIEFLQAFGGAVYPGEVESGMTAPKILWKTTSATMRQAATLLSSVDSPKRNQLQILAQWPDSNVVDNKFRRELSEQHRSFRSQPLDEGFHFSSREQFGGYFDARLSITVPASRAHMRSLVLALTHTDHVLIRAINTFLGNEGLPQCSVFMHGGRWYWASYNAEVSKSILQFVQPFMRKQRLAVESALTFSEQTTSNVREHIFRCNDNNAVLRRMDDDWCNMSWELSKLKQKKGSRSSLSSQIEELKKRRAAHALNLKTVRLRQRARDMLSRGAQWSSEMAARNFTKRKRFRLLDEI